MKILNHFKRLLKWCPQPENPISTRLKQHSKQLTVAIVATVLVTSIFAVDLSYFNHPAALPAVLPMPTPIQSSPSPTPIPTASPSSASLLTALGITEVLSSLGVHYGVDAPYNRLYISGYVTNIGNGTAFNAGLHVVAYAADGTLEINMTVPLDNGVVYGTGAGADAYGSPSQFGNLASGQTATVDINILHDGTVTTWSVTPVCTNYP